MAKRSAPKRVEPEDTSQEIPDAPVAAQSSMSKADACRAALAAGIDNAEDALEFTRKNFGVEIKQSDFMLYRKKQGVAAAPAKRGRKHKASDPAATARPVEDYVAPPEEPKPAGEPDVLLALEGIKDLVGQFGADKVKRMVDLLS